MPDKQLEKAINIIKETADPERVILFGSRANGRNQPNSDYDLLVLKRNITLKRELVHKIYLNLKGIGVSFDIIVGDIEKYESLKDDPYMIYSEAYKNGRIVYERT
jgi:uncharacterized protein